MHPYETSVTSTAIWDISKHCSQWWYPEKEKQCNDFKNWILEQSIKNENYIRILFSCLNG